MQTGRPASFSLYSHIKKQRNHSSRNRSPPHTSFSETEELSLAKFTSIDNSPRAHICTSLSEPSKGAVSIMSAFSKTVPHRSIAEISSSPINPISHTYIGTSPPIFNKKTEPPSTTMIADSGVPQKRQIHTSGAEIFHSCISDASKPPLTISMLSEAQEVMQDMSETFHPLHSSRESASKVLPAQTSNCEAGQVFPFLKLPRELRDKIYRSVLVWSRPLRSMHPPTCPLTDEYIPKARRKEKLEAEAREAKEREKSPEVKQKYEERLQQIWIAEFGSATKEGILRVNKEIRDEARDIFFKENYFFYDEEIIRDDPSSNGKRRIRRPMYNFEYRVKLPDTYKQARTIHAAFSRGSNTLISEFVQLILQNRNLRTLNVYFQNLSVPMMKEARKEIRKLEKLKAVEQISLTMSGTYRYDYQDLLGTKRERALMDFLEETEKKVLARRS